jgi:hypothetical protein
MRVEDTEFGGWRRCLRLANGSIELVATTEVGPRIIFAGLAGGRNLFHTVPGDLGRTGGESYRLYGGHRLWHAPEARPRTYVPDNTSVAVTVTEDSVMLHQRTESPTGIRKAMAVSLGEGAAVRVVHRLINEGPWPVRLAPWTISMMAPGGFLAVPQEERRTGPDALPPSRPVVLWPYTDMADPRWTWGTRHILLRQDPAIPGPQKFGTLNRRGWAAYCLGDVAMLQSVPHDPSAQYADFGCNFEAYANAHFLEMETLGPLRELAPGDCIEHVVHWLVAPLEASAGDADLEAKLAPLAGQLARAITR